MSSSVAGSSCWVFEVLSFFSWASSRFLSWELLFRLPVAVVVVAKVEIEVELELVEFELVVDMFAGGLVLLSLACPVGSEIDKISKSEVEWSKIVLVL